MSSKRTIAAAAVGVAALFAASACGGSGDSSSSGSAGTTSGSGSSSGVAAATVAVTKAQAALAAYPVPTQSLAGVSGLKGKTVYYIPITQQAPQFAITAAALKQALGTVGLSLQVCNGNSNPSQVSACVNQAVGASAGAVVTDSIPYGMAANALAAAQAKGIPVISTDQIADSAHPASATLAYVEGAGQAMLVAAADWIIADSAGKAKVLINESTDSPSTIAYVAAAQAEFSKNCPSCSVQINKISSANFPLIASSTSSALLRNPGTQYVVSEFEQYLQPTMGGIQQSGQAAKVKLVATAAQLGGLQQLKSGGMLTVDVGQASGYQGWVTADAALRMMLKQPLPTYSIPTRIFTKDNVSALTLSAGAQSSGEWFGPATYSDQFKEIWGVK